MIVVNGINFRNTQHEQSYNTILNRMWKQDSYHKSVAYLLSLDDTCIEHIDKIFDFDLDIIIPDCLNSGWQTSGTLKVCRLAFNLWNDCCTNGEYYRTERGSFELPSVDYTPSVLFNTYLAPYFWQAIMIRFPFIQNLDGVKNGI